MIDSNLEWYIDQNFLNLCRDVETDNQQLQQYSFGVYKGMLGAALLVNAVGSPQYDYLCKAGNAVYETVLPDDIREVL